MTTTQDVRNEVLHMVQKINRNGQPVTKALLNVAYKIVRANAIADTLLWKKRYITIEEV